MQLYGENNIISYLEYEWASNGITGTDASYSSFDNVFIDGSLTLTSNGIYLDGTNTQVSFTNNQILVAGDWGIYCQNADSSVFSGNEITSDKIGILSEYSSN